MQLNTPVFCVTVMEIFIRNFRTICFFANSANRRIFKRVMQFFSASRMVPKGQGSSISMEMFGR